MVTPSEGKKYYRFEEVDHKIHRDRQLCGKKYIQIYRMGLDEDAHKIRTTSKELINHKINEIFENIKKLVEFLGKINESFVIYVISDHGIKWDFEKNYGKGAHGGISFEECFVPLIIIEG